MKRRSIIIALILLLVVQGCAPLPKETVDDGQQTIETSPTVHRPPSTTTSSPLPTPKPISTSTPLPTPKPAVRVIALNGNIYIRRGPGTAYNRIGLLKSGESAQVIGRDVLSKWAQISIPGSDATGWVSLLTPYTQVEGEISSVESFTFNEWPEPAYIKNCTEHDLLLSPGDLYLYSLWFNPQYWNETQVDPGVYQIYDLFVSGEPLIQTVDIREGETVYITVNGLGDYHNCPAEH